MDREALLQLSREGLLELILVLTARVAELEAVVVPLGGPPKMPDHSSVPPSQGCKLDRSERRKKRGPKRRPAEIGRWRQHMDVVVRCRPSHCGGAPLPIAPAAGQATPDRYLSEQGLPILLNGIGYSRTMAVTVGR